MYIRGIEKYMDRYDTIVAAEDGDFHVAEETSLRILVRSTTADSDDEAIRPQ